MHLMPNYTYRKIIKLSIILSLNTIKLCKLIISDNCFKGITYIAYMPRKYGW